MAFYSKNLYNDVIKKTANYFDSLKVVSGYASSKFLNRVIRDFPNHKICLIIGMASKGIAIKDHDEFRRICKEFINVEVFYYVGNPPNHMKIYQWYGDGNSTLSFIGSANFSEAGFFNHSEILAPTLDDFSLLITEVLELSIHCLDERAEREIPLYENEEDEMDESEKNIFTSVDLNDKSGNAREVEGGGRTKNNSCLMKLFLKNSNLTAADSVAIELILKDDPHWDTKALNNWNRRHKDKNDSYIDVGRTNKLGIQKIDFFPREIDVQLVSDDNVEWIVRRVGEYGRELVVSRGPNFYEYFKGRIGINEERRLSFEDFSSYGRTNVNFYKLNDNEYLLDFSLDNIEQITNEL